MEDHRPTAELSGQQKIWSHFQNQDPGSFDAARPRLDFLVKQIARRSATSVPSLLNIGIGSGHLERTAHQRGWRVHSLDPDRQSAERLAAEGIAAHVGSIESIPLENSCLEFVVASEVLEHLTSQQRCDAVKEISRVLKPGGWFLGTVPYREDLATGHVVCLHCGKLFHRWGHQSSFDLKSIADELSPRFEMERVVRTAFVSYRDRDFVGKIKSLVRFALAKCGQSIAIPSIYWVASKKVTIDDEGR